MSETSEIKTPWLHLLVIFVFFFAIFSTASMTLGFFFHAGWSMFQG